MKEDLTEYMPILIQTMLRHSDYMRSANIKRGIIATSNNQKRTIQGRCCYVDTSRELIE